VQRNHRIPSLPSRQRPPSVTGTLVRWYVRPALSVALLLSVIAGAVVRGTPTKTVSAFAAQATLHQTTGAYTPSQIKTAYNLNRLVNQGIDGSGETIALIEFDRFALSDLQQFDAANNLSDPVIETTYSGGKTFSLPQQEETTLDLEWAHALAPAAKIHIYYLHGSEADASGWREVATAVDSAVASGAGTVSLSFGTCAPTSGSTVARKAFARALAHKVGVFVSSGDSGALPGPVKDCGNKFGVSYPGSDPSVVSVGGTSLLLNDDDTIAKEAAWSLSGGGKAKPLPRPFWQVMSTLGPGRYRFAPDVAFVGNQNTGVAIVYRGRWEAAGGTSLGAPAWAGIWALLEQNTKRAGKILGPAPSLLYQIGNSSQYATAFDDVTTGSNGHYRAGVGWDAVTGWGTPNVSGLAAVLSTLAHTP